MTSPQTDSSDSGAGAARQRGPSPDKTARTRRAIAVAALDTFLERGFSATRMIDVAQRAGVAKGTLYLYFTDKEALFEGVLDRGHRRAGRERAADGTRPRRKRARFFEVAWSCL